MLRVLLVGAGALLDEKVVSAMLPLFGGAVVSVVLVFVPVPVDASFTSVLALVPVDSSLTPVPADPSFTPAVPSTNLAPHLRTSLTPGYTELFNQQIPSSGPKATSTQVLVLAHVSMHDSRDGEGEELMSPQGRSRSHSRRKVRALRVVWRVLLAVGQVRGVNAVGTGGLEVDAVSVASGLEVLELAAVLSVLDVEDEEASVVLLSASGTGGTVEVSLRAVVDEELEVVLVLPAPLAVVMVPVDVSLPVEAVALPDVVSLLVVLLSVLEAVFDPCDEVDVTVDEMFDDDDDDDDDKVLPDAVALVDPLTKPDDAAASPTPTQT